jgi:hypothetical protein
VIQSKISISLYVRPPSQFSTSGADDLATNVEFVLVAADDCDDCLNDAESYVPHTVPQLMIRYKADDSRTITASRRALAATAIFPTSQGSIDVIQMNGNLVTERITDPRQDSYDRVIGILSEVEEVTELGQRTRPANLPEGVSGFFGLGVNQVSYVFFWRKRS